jgi:adenine phosphoribosyltransferase
MLTLQQLQAHIRDVPDFPQRGVVFKDITPLLRDAAALNTAVDSMAQPFRDRGVDAVVAVEARGYILGAPIAMLLGAGFVPVRKVGKLPWHTFRVDYSLEYGSSTLEMHRDGLLKGHSVLMVDDVLATGGTLMATARLVEQSGAQVVGMAVLLEIEALGGRRRLEGYNLFSLLRC